MFHFGGSFENFQKLERRVIENHVLLKINGKRFICLFTLIRLYFDIDFLRNFNTPRAEHCPLLFPNLFFAA